VAQTFAAFRRWVEEVSAKCGGDCSEADNSLVCTFPSETAAVSVAAQLQLGMDRFNQERNRLARPLRLRCGIVVGSIAGDGERQMLIERADGLRRRSEPGDILVPSEMTAAALLELGCLAPLRRDAGEEPVFSWRAGQRGAGRA
jgi:hypothetical protein